MSDTIKLAQTAKLRLYVDKDTAQILASTAEIYRQACNEVSEYAFQNECMTNIKSMHSGKYRDIRNGYGLMSQMACSVFKTVAARYKTVERQLERSPYKVVYEDKGVKTAICFERDLQWLQKPVLFSRPQVDLVRGRDYSFVNDKKEGSLLSIGTLKGRVRVRYTNKAFEHLMTDGWKLGTAKLVEKDGIWYLHIGCTKEVSAADPKDIKHVVGGDRGLRFLITTFDDTGRTTFFDGRRIAKIRDRYQRTRASLQSKGTKGAKRVLRRISRRENRFMADVNHSLSKALSERFTEPTLFVLEDLTGVSFDKRNMHSKDQARELSSWAFYDLEQDLEYKAQEAGHIVLKVPAAYTSQRCPICGSIRKENRDHKKHEYVCDKCGYRSNDDRIAAMNLFDLGIEYLNDPSVKPCINKK